MQGVCHAWCGEHSAPLGLLKAIEHGEVRAETDTTDNSRCPQQHKTDVHRNPTTTTTRTHTDANGRPQKKNESHGGGRTLGAGGVILLLGGLTPPPPPPPPREQSTASKQPKHRLTSVPGEPKFIHRLLQVCTGEVKVKFHCP